MWNTERSFEDIRYETTDEGQIAKITINRPEVRNAFRPKTVLELLQAFDRLEGRRSSAGAVQFARGQPVQCVVDQRRLA